MDQLILPIGEEYIDYLHDESRKTGRADSISFPRNEGELRQILALMNERGVPVTVQGGRTGLAAGAVPQGGHIINLSRMDQVLALREEDGRFRITVQPGLRLNELRRHLELKRPEIARPDAESAAALTAFAAAPEQFFSPDPTETTAALGGMAACNSSGARTYLYGPTRPHILGLRLALADGDLLELRRGQCFAKGRRLSLTTEGGRRLGIDLPGYTMPRCKNAAGFFAADDMDAIDLIIGSDGTLGVICQLELSLLPKPPCICGMTCFFPSEGQVLGMVESARRQVERVAAIEYFDHGVMEMLARRQTWDSSLDDIPPLPKGLSNAVYFELHCEDRAQVMAGIREISRLMEEHGGDSRHTWVGWNRRELQRLHAFRHTVPESSNLVIDRRKRDYPALSKCSADMAVPDERLYDVMALYRQGLSEEKLESAIWGHIGNNHVHVSMLPRDMEEYERAQALIRRWASAVSAWGGAVSAEHGIGKSKRALLTIMYGEEQVAQMAAVKRVFDPKGVLSPGNLFPAGPDSCGISSHRT